MTGVGNPGPGVPDMFSVFVPLEPLTTYVDLIFSVMNTVDNVLDVHHSDSV